MNAKLKNSKKQSDAEKDGVIAIMFLDRMVEKPRTEEEALTFWREMDDAQRTLCMLLYKMGLGIEQNRRDLQ